MNFFSAAGAFGSDFVPLPLAFQAVRCTTATFPTELQTYSRVWLMRISQGAPRLRNGWPSNFPLDPPLLLTSSVCRVPTALSPQIGEQSMSPTRYFLVQHNDEWMIQFADEEFGPYKSKSEAMLFAVEAARKFGERGAETEVCLMGENGFFHAEWSNAPQSLHA
jgi:hypothetical protein